MTNIFEMPLQAVAGQLLIGLINGSFYALLSLGLAIIFGLLKVINFAHGSLYMLGALFAYLLLNWLGIGFWPALIIAPCLVGAFALLIERLLLRHIYGLDHLYGLLLTFGLALVIEGGLREVFGSAGLPYAVPAALTGVWDTGYAIVPKFRGFVVIASLTTCIAVWLLIERTKLGSILRASTDNPLLVQAFGINVPVLLSVTYMLGASLAGLAGVLAAPIYQVSPLMGTNIIIIVFAVVVAGGMGSIAGSIVTGYGLGVLEALTKLVYSPASNIVIFVVMAVVLLVRPAGLFGREE
ncbi:branched-chain amino acid ABC transporter permease [Hydrogenophaga atypica]|uniref:Branched-chain amino acid ABC transporter permease n=1 Tax=Hydrogenophaga atypica TaxID=249409 RepID=A0ABW2QVC1_9BURK